MAIKNTPEKIYDLRTIEYSLSKGLVSQKDYDKYLNSLPDDEGNYELVEIKGDSEEDLEEEEDLDEDS